LLNYVKGFLYGLEIIPSIINNKNDSQVNSWNFPIITSNNWKSAALETCVFSYRVNLWLWRNVTVQIMAHPPKVVADRLSKSNTATATEKVDIGGVVWKWTQVHPVSLILQTQATVEISWALPEMIRQSRLCTIWQTTWEYHTHRNDICQIPSEHPAKLCQCYNEIGRPKFNAPWYSLLATRKLQL